LPENGNQDFQIGEKTRVKANSPFTYSVIRHGNSVSCENKSLLTKNIRNINLSENGLTIEGKGLSPDEEIIINPNAIIYDSNRLLGNLSKNKILRTKDGIVIPRLGKDIEYKQTDKNTIELGKHNLVKNYGDRVEFIMGDFLGTKNTYTLLKLKDGYVFYDKRNYGVRIKIDGNKIYVEENGKMINYYEFMVQ
jgi:hypothetical protein